MYKLQVEPSEALNKMSVIAHKQFVDSISKWWEVYGDCTIRPNSICWLFVWATNSNSDWGEQLKHLFDEFMPFSFADFDERVGKELAKSLRYNENDAEVDDILAQRLGSLYPDGPSSAELKRIEETTTAEGYFSPLTLQDERRRRLREVVERRGQPDFRNKLIAAYSGRCTVTSCDAVAALEAAHIVPYTGPQSNHLTNGLLLRADIHTLFDLDLIGIDPESMAISVASAIKATVYAELDGKNLLLPVNAADIPNQEALTQRWGRFRRYNDGDE